MNGLAGVTRTDPIVLRAARTGFASGHRGGALVVAFTVGDVGLVALSQQVSDVNETADLVERRILIAAALALLVAMLVGWASAHAVTRRLSHLEQGARRIALGEFDRPIGDQSPDELGQLGRAFDLMQTRLDRADRVRKEFVANASHELRTPLFSLSGFMELLDDEDLDDETRAAFLQQMREQVNRLTKLATDLLDLSRLDADAVAVEHEPIDMAAAARGLVREFRGLAVGHGSRISLVKPEADLPHAIGDELRVQQVGRALLDNAIRHNPSGTQVRVAVTADNGSVRLDVADNGPAIDDQTARHLFERFYRGEATSAAGSGLGLAIARELAERMDGRLELLSEDGETRFTFSLPGRARLTCVHATDRNHRRDRRIGGRRGGCDRDRRARVLERRLRRIDHRDHGRRGNRRPGQRDRVAERFRPCRHLPGAHPRRGHDHLGVPRRRGRRQRLRGLERRADHDQRARGHGLG